MGTQGATRSQAGRATPFLPCLAPGQRPEGGAVTSRPSMSVLCRHASLACSTSGLLSVREPGCPRGCLAWLPGATGIWPAATPS